MPETNLILLASVIEPLRAANRIAGRRLYRWTLQSPDGAAIETTSGVSIAVASAFSPGPSHDPLFILSSYHWRRGLSATLRRQLSQAARFRSLIAGIESGSWLMAEASLLDGGAAALHWEDAEEFAAAYPQIKVTSARFVIDGKRITTGGPLPTLDLMLELIRREQGYSLALEVSRLFIYEPDRPSETLSSEALPLVAPMRLRDERVKAALALMEAQIETPVALIRIAKRIGVSVRRLQDLFQDSLGVTPHTHYLALRLNAARRRVIETTAPLADIAAATGFNSAAAFSRSYRAHYRESPRETRQRLRPQGKMARLF
ncbi:AraC family transcriptional regulator [Xaviernesmea oryzae]|uniref:AraC family transcriptional regulator n=1 Tax=Xaviernesmea oryzae TaxID=464029 RepID=A0A1Q9B055_9HYPH|nr:GlxA family transcriptional regulator [Xaviernesmea oryzae]OLP61361.1 AraC family transcriptional regulator [Xaviernesmea oryzae]